MHVLVVAHGPRSATKKAVSRVRRWGDLVESIHVVPASAAARGGRGMFGDAEVTDLIGSRGVRSISRNLPGEPLLLIHDDAALTKRGLQTMLDELDAATFVVPYSNEQGLETSIGALPSADDAGSTLDESRIGLARRSVLEARHACLLGRGKDVAELGGSLVMPGSTLTRADANIVAAPCAAAHDLSCNRRLVEDQIDPHQPLLVASMIVRDEEHTLPEALASIEGLVDRMEIFDTGSVDGTIDVIRRHGGVVSEIEWRNDFGWARTQALAACRDSEFVLMFDADERIKVKDVHIFRRWLRTWSHEIDGLLVDVQSARGDGGSHTSNASCRIARAAGASFEGAIHEALTLLTTEGTSDVNVMMHRDVVVTHQGYLPEVVEAKSKPERNIAIARAQYDRDRSLKTMIDLARSLRMEDPDDPEAEALFREALEILEDESPPASRSFLKGVVSSYELTHGNLDRAIELAEEALDEVAGEDVALVTVGHALVSRGEFDRLIQIHRKLSVRADGNPMFRIPRNVARYEAYVGRALLHVGDVDEGKDLLRSSLESDAEGVADIVVIAVAEVLSSGFPPEWILPLVVADSSGVIVDTVARNVKPLLTATLCHAALEMGADHPHLVTTLVTAALVGGDHDLARRAVGYLPIADHDAVPKLADLARRKGDAELAALLEKRATLPVAGVAV